MDPVAAIMNEIQNTLPKMSDYIATHIDRNVPSETMQGQKCLICQQDFDPNQDEGCFASSQDNTCIRLPPCNHMFHAHCVQDWLDSTQPARNSCPTCRTPFCKLNVLDPVKQATLESERLSNRDQYYNISNHASILSFVDTQFSSQGPGDLANYIAIPRAARDFWENSGNDVVCSEHFSVGLHWVEMMAANRVKELMLEEGVVKTWPGVQFMGMWTVLTGQFQRIYPAAVRFGMLMRDAGVDGQDAADADRQDADLEGQGGASNGSTVVDENLYTFHLMRHPPNVQGLVVTGKETGAGRSSEGSTIVDDNLYADHLARHPPIGPGFDATGQEVFAAAQENVADIPDIVSPAPEPSTTPPNDSATLGQIQACHGKNFYKYYDKPGPHRTPKRIIKKEEIQPWIQDADADQSEPASIASEPVAWHAQRSASESIVCDDPTEDEDEMDVDATPTRSPEYNPYNNGPTVPPTQWVTTPTFPPVRPIPEPIDDFVYIPPTLAEARWMARVQERKKEPDNEDSVWYPTGIWARD
jgi:hypothetical protein